jgi:hypothetical protein
VSTLENRDGFGVGCTKLFGVAYNWRYELEIGFGGVVPLEFGDSGSNWKIGVYP